MFGRNERHRLVAGIAGLMCVVLLKDATEKQIPSRKQTPDVFIEKTLGTDAKSASELAERILTTIFEVDSGEVTIYSGDFQRFRWM